MEAPISVPFGGSELRQLAVHAEGCCCTFRIKDIAEKWKQRENQVKKFEFNEFRIKRAE